MELGARTVKHCPKSQRCTLGGRWKLHLALVDLDEQGIDARIVDIQASEITKISRAMWGHDVSTISGRADRAFASIDGDKKIWV